MGVRQRWDLGRTRQQLAAATDRQPRWAWLLLVPIAVVAGVVPVWRARPARSDPPLPVPHDVLLPAIAMITAIDPPPPPAGVVVQPHDPDELGRRVRRLHEIGLRGSPAHLPEIEALASCHDPGTVDAAVMAVARIAARQPADERQRLRACLDRIEHIWLQLTPREGSPYRRDDLLYARWRVHETGHTCTADAVRELLAVFGSSTKSAKEFNAHDTYEHWSPDSGPPSGYAAEAYLVEYLVPHIAARTVEPSARALLAEMGIDIGPAMPALLALRPSLPRQVQMDTCRARLDLARLPDDQRRVDYAINYLRDAKGDRGELDIMTQTLADQHCGGRRAELIALLEGQPSQHPPASHRALRQLAADDGHPDWLKAVAKDSGKRIFAPDSAEAKAIRASKSTAAGEP